ncbi:hypothetical protein [Mucilaginibacter xinganensis]|uniref:Uncharacterized protein n=1 Tax=Mucilaginibacter xinganensis TaxID=1234841 RepID=A0A223NRK5_9SPHI|nr:hypothetical protein [Mucilaginibacter xinganensis]ASU32334.1 hypothetical protein MuYL_0431 [Mucilaginibacter xinganensis]
MHQDQLLKGEILLSYSDEEIITLTTHRVRYKSKSWGQSKFISIMLEKISSLQVVYISYPFLLIIGIIMSIMGFVTGLTNNYSSGIMSLSIIPGVVFAIAYFITRKHICVISSDGGAPIIFKTEGMSAENITEIMDKVELAKNNRMVQLQSLQYDINNRYVPKCPFSPSA